MGIFGQVKSAVSSILPGLFADPDLAIDVTWKMFAGSVFDEAQGVNVETYTDYALSAIRVEKEIGSIQTRAAPPGPWMMSIGDVVYLFKSEDVPAGASIRDSLVDGEYTYGIKKIFPIFNLITKVEVKGYA